jgi:hypothetical protein
MTLGLIIWLMFCIYSTYFVYFRREGRAAYAGSLHVPNPLSGEMAVLSVKIMNKQKRDLVDAIVIHDGSIDDYFSSEKNALDDDNQSSS